MTFLSRGPHKAFKPTVTGFAIRLLDFSEQVGFARTREASLIQNGL